MDHLPRGWKQPYSEEIPDTTLAAWASACAREDSLEPTMLELFRQAGRQGLTDDEIERITGRRHQTVSALRRGLCKRARVTETVFRRKTRSDHWAIVRVLVALLGAAPGMVEWSQCDKCRQVDFFNPGGRYLCARCANREEEELEY